MPTDLDLSTIPVNPRYLDEAKEPESGGIGDYARAVGAGGYGVVGSLASGLDYLMDTDPDSGLNRAREWADQGAAGQIKQMSPAGQRDYAAGFLPGEGSDIWDSDVSMTRALGLKVAGAAPSLLASVLPGGVAAGAARAALARLGASAATAGTAGANVGMGVAGATGGLMAAGDVSADIEKAIRDASDDDLKAGSKLYGYLRERGYDEQVAKKVLVEYAEGNKPIIAGAVGALLERFGAGAMAARGAAGVAEAGVLKGIRRGGGEEAVTEALQSGSQEAVTQQGKIEGGLQDDFDWRAILEQATQGGVVGGILGGGVGGVVGGRAGRGVDAQRGSEVPDAATAPGVAGADDLGGPEVGPEVTPEAQVAANGATRTAADRAREGLAEAGSMLDRQAADIASVETPAKRGLDPAVNSALADSGPVATETPAVPVDQPEVFQPADEFEVDPDFVPGEAPAAPEVTAASEAAQPADLPPVPAPTVTAPAQITQNDTTGMASMGGGMADAIGANLIDMLWGKVEAGETREGGRSSAVLQAAKLIRDNGGVLGREDIRGLATEVNAAKDQFKSGPEFQAAMRDIVARRVPAPAAQAAPGQAPATPELPAAPEITAPAVAPSEVTETPIAELDLSTVQTVAPTQQAPRVLPAQPAAPKRVSEQRTQRISTAEAANFAEGKSVPTSLSQNPEDYNTQSDRTSVYRLAEAEQVAATKAGRPLKKWAEDVLAVRGKTRGQGAGPVANRQRYAEARQALSDEIAKAVAETGVRRETVKEVQQREAQQQRIANSRKVEEIINANPMPSAALRGIPSAVREHAKRILDAAKAAGIRVPEGNTDDPHLVYLKAASGVLGSNANADVRAQFISDDFFIRQGAGEEITEGRRAERVGRDVSYDEAARRGGEEKEGTDVSEAYDAQGPSDIASAQEVEASPVEDEVRNDDAPATARSEGPVEGAGHSSAVRIGSEGNVSAQGAETVLAGADRKGTFAIESRGRRKVTPPGKARVQAAAANVAARTQPTEAQKEAGNYPKKHVRAIGLDISIENPKGSTRSGRDGSGREWSVEMPADYGYIRRTSGADGDHVDVYLGPAADNFRWKNSGEVFVVNQKDLGTGQFDEHKVLLGFQSYDDALKTYKAGFSDRKGNQRVMSVARMTQQEFKNWLDRGDMKVPALDHLQRAEAETAAANTALDNARAEMAAIMQERDVATADVTDPIDAMEIAKPFVNRIMAVRKRIADEYGQPTADRIRNEARKQTKAEPERPAAMQRTRSAEDERLLREFQDLYGDLTAETDYDPSDGITRAYSPRTGVAVRPVTTMPLRDMLNGTNFSTVPGVNERISPFMARRLREMVGDVPVHVVSNNDMLALTQDLIDGGAMGSLPLGYYEPSLRTIIIDQSALTNEAAVAHLLIHEGLHAAFLNTIDANPQTKQLIRSMMDAVEAATGRSGQDTYGLTNEHEFISEAFSNPRFQEVLRGVPAPVSFKGLAGRISNIWEMFISGLRKYLGLSREQETMLDAAVRVGAVLSDLRTADMSRPSSPRAVAPAALEGRVATELRDAMSDRSRAAGGMASRWAVRVKTLEQLRQTYGGLFEGHLDRAIQAMQRMQPFVDRERKEGEAFAEAFLNLQKRAPEVAQESALLRIDMTMANVNLLPGKPSLDALKAANKHLFGTDPKTSDISAAWQSKANIEALQARFSKLPADVQKQMLDEQKYYAKMQDRITRKLIENILDYFGGDAVKNREQIITKTMAGTLTQEDAESINNATLFNSLKDAKELRAQKGAYYPLMRHGDYVVRTTDAITDTMGGVEVEPGVVEFRAAKDKDARAAAKRFAEKTGLTVTRVGKSYYDPATGERVKAADATAKSEVGYRVSVQKEGVHFFDSATQAEKFVRENRANHSQVSDVQVRKDIESRGDLTGSQLASLVNSANARKDIPEATRQMMATAIGQAAVRLMSGNRIQSRSLPRNRVQGASTEYGRNALSYATSASGYLGKLTYMPTVREAMGGMRGLVEGERVYDKQGADRRAVMMEMERRVNANETGLNRPSRAMQDLMQVAMLTRLAGPGHSLINATQVAMVSYPVLAGQHGSVSAAMELSRAYKDIGAVGVFGQGVANTGRAFKGWGNVGLNTSDLWGSIKGKLKGQSDGAALTTMLNELQERGALDDGAAFELAAAVSAGRGAGGTALAKMDRIFRQAPAAVEAVNRSTTAIAAFRLAKRKGMDDAAARDYAYVTVSNTQGDYSAMNAAPWFSNPIARPFLQFKKYGQMMTHLYMDMIYRTFRGESRAVRMEALKQFGHLVAMQTLVAGALSVPGMELAKAGFVLAAMLGLGGGWDDQERRIRRLADEALGKDWSELVRKGLVTRAVGIDLSNRLSLADMWTFGEPKKYTKSEITGWIATQMFGAPGGTALDFREALVHAQEGDWMKAAQKGAPVKFVGDSFKAVSAYMDGRMSGPEAALQSLSIKPARIANQDEARSERIAESQEAKDAKNKLRNRYLNARTAGERLKLKAEVRAYNKTASSFNKLSIPSMEKMIKRDRQEGLR